jgi:hypothetical protein
VCENNREEREGGNGGGGGRARVRRGEEISAACSSMYLNWQQFLYGRIEVN